MTHAGEGQEVLVVDGDDKVQRGLGQLLEQQHLAPTLVGDPERARALAREKYFACALVDLDTPQPNAGLELVRWLRQEAAATTVIVMASRKGYEAAVEAFRAGAADVILKAPDQVEHLRSRVVSACVDVRTQTDDSNLLREVLGVHEEFLKRLMDTSRRVTELEERLAGHAPGELDGECAVLLVEPAEGAWLGEHLKGALSRKGGYTLRTAGSGGEGLDAASTGVFQLALVCNALPDLPGSMVVNTLKAQQPETIAILYTPPVGNKPGKAEIIEGSRAIAVVPELGDSWQMVERLDELREAFRRKVRERRYLAGFRQDNYELLKRYGDLKQKLARAARK